VIAGTVSGVVLVVLLVILLLIFWKKCCSSASDKEDASLLTSVRRLGSVDLRKGVVNIAMDTFNSDPVDDPNTYSVLYEFKAANEEEVDLEPQDTVHVIERTDTGWWRGTVPGGRTGWFPAEYVEPIKRQQVKSPAVTVVSTPKEAALLASAEQQNVITYGVTNTAEVNTANTSAPSSTAVTPIETVSVNQPSVLKSPVVTVVSTPKEATLLASAEVTNLDINAAYGIFTQQQNATTYGVTDTTEISKAVTPIEAVSANQPSILVATQPAPRPANEKKNITTLFSPKELEASITGVDQPIQSEIVVATERTGITVELPKAAPGMATAIAELATTIKHDQGKKIGDNDVAVEPRKTSEPMSLKTESDTQQTTSPIEQPETLYEAMYDYTATREDELSLAFGDRILVKEKGDDGWWKGTNSNDQTGWFPYNYVSVLEPDSLSESATDSGVNSMKDEEEGTEYRAIYFYEAHRDDEITLREGDVVLVFEAAESGWWRGSVGQKDGWFPGSYVEPIITEDVLDDKPVSTADFVVGDSAHSATQEKPSADTGASKSSSDVKATKSISVLPGPRYVSELTGELEKRKQTGDKREEFNESLKSIERPLTETAHVKEVESSKLPTKTPLPVPTKRALSKVDESPSVVDIPVLQVKTSTDTKTDLVSDSAGDSAKMQTTKSQDSQKHHHPGQQQTTTPARHSDQIKVAPLSEEKPPSRPVLPKRTVKSKLVKLPQGGAVKKRTLAATVRPPPPNRALPPPPARELPSPPRKKREQAAAAKETIGKTKPITTSPKAPQRKKRPPGAMPRVPTRRNLLVHVQESQQKPSKPALPATDVSQATAGRQSAEAVSKPARPPPRTQPVAVTAKKESKTTQVKSAKVDEVQSATRHSSGQELPVITKPSVTAGTSPREPLGTAENPLDVSSKQTSAINKPALNPKPAIKVKPSPTTKSLPSDRPSVKPPVGVKPPNIVTNIASQQLSSGKADSVSPTVTASKTPGVAPSLEAVLTTSLLSPQHGDLPRVPNSPLRPTAAPTQKIKESSDSQQAQPLPKPRSLASEDKPRRPSKPPGLSNDDNVRKQFNSEAQTTIQKSASEPTADTSSSSLNKKPEPTVLFIAPGHDSGILKPLPIVTTDKKGERQILQKPEKKTTSNKSEQEHKPEEPPARPKPPVKRPQPQTTLSESADARKEPLNDNPSVNPQPAPRKKPTEVLPVEQQKKPAVDMSTGQPKPQPRPKQRTGQAEETVVEARSSPKAKPPRPSKPPVMKTESPSPKSPKRPESSKSSIPEKASIMPHGESRDSSSETNSQPERPHSATKRPEVPQSAAKQNKPGRPPAPSSDSKSKPHRPPPPKTAESASKAPGRPQSKPVTSQMRSNPLRKAIATYHAQRSDELTFNEGDLIVEVQPVDQHGWCKGKLTTTGKEGMYPGNFVENA
jgi:hypothetical protein